MKAVLVHDWLTGMRGGEKVLEALCGLLPGAPLFTLFHFAGSVSPAIESHPIHTSFLQRAPGIRRHYRRYLPLFPAAIEDFDLAGFDLVVSSSHCVAKGVIPPPGSFHLCYCHTPMRYAWDQEHAYFPRRRGAGPRLRSLALTALRAWDAAASARVDLFVANSSFVAARIRRYYGRDAEVVHPPVDVDFFTPGEAAAGEERPAPYCLMVSALAPYKRLELGIAACARLGLPLRIVGTGAERARLERAAADAPGSGPRAELLGGVSAERLRDLYRGALCLLQPGTEDFGIGAVEALACGTPVVALAQGGVLDVVEDGRHGVLYQESAEQESASALADAIDKARRIRFNGLDLRGRAEDFSAPRFNRSMQSLLSRKLV
ncbi:MAG TPA: glycosyltransferase [Thermoanaerobaculia bacterium]|nr:glycosyltransferase [Thermoanaerobaculia bacterium]